MVCNGVSLRMEDGEAVALHQIIKIRLRAPWKVAGTGSAEKEALPRDDRRRGNNTDVTTKYRIYVFANAHPREREDYSLPSFRFIKQILLICHTEQF